MPFATMCCRNKVVFLRTVLLVALRIQLVTGWRTHGTLQPQKNGLVYVGKFCFDYVAGQSSGALEVDIQGQMKGGDSWKPKKPKDFPTLPDFPPTPGGLYLALFSDRTVAWQMARRKWNDLTATEILERAAAVRAVTPGEDGKFQANVMVLGDGRPVFVYFTFVFWSADVSADSVPISYTIHAENKLAGFEREFSVDERGAVFLQLVGLIGFGTAVVGLSVGARVTDGAGALRSRPLLQLLVVSCGCSALGCGCRLIDELVYAMAGEGLGAVQVAGELWAVVARLTLSTLHLFVASGKALLQSETEVARKRRVQLLVAGIVVVSMGCEVYVRYFGDLDWSTTLYFYASWPGFLILTLNSCLFAEVCLATWRLYKQPETSVAVKRFYVATFIAAVLYFAALPATCILAHMENPWERKKLVMRTEVTTRLLTTIMLCFCLRPSKLDRMINARLETPENRQHAVEMAQGLS